MKTFLECIPCFLNQAIEASKNLNLSIQKQKLILDKLCRIIPKFKLSSTPPEMGERIHKIIKQISKNPDPYKIIKQKSNQLCLKNYNKFKNKIYSSKNPLLSATMYAIAGNIIDYGVRNITDIEKELNTILEKMDKKIKNKNYFKFNEFEKKLKNSQTLVYIGDNAGEIVFDKILIELIKEKYLIENIVYAVRNVPIINDVTIEDALQVNMQEVAKVISSGSNAPGTLLKKSSKNFLKILKHADLIISKGQGNFEALSDTKLPIFFLFIAKCKVVANHLNASIGDFILSSF